MLFLAECLLAALAFNAVQATPPPYYNPFPTFSQKLIYQPESDFRVIYPRGAELADGTLLATSSMSGPDKPYFPVFSSKDGGRNWKYISNITDQVNGWGLAAQPYLYQINRRVGRYPPGTVLAAGSLSQWLCMKEYLRY
jgi:hypothetical protein